MATTRGEKFSQLVRRALDEGPQIVTRHGEEVVVVLSASEFHRLSDNPLDFKEFLLAAPDLSSLDLERARSWRDPSWNRAPPSA